MALKQNNTKSAGKREKVVVPADTHPALVCQITDLGKQFNTDYQSGEIQTWPDGNPKINDMVMITFEFPTVTHTFDEEIGPQPLWVSKQVNVRSQFMKDLLSSAGQPDSGNIDIAALGGSLVWATTGITAGGNAKVVGVSSPKSKYLLGDEVVDSSSFELSKGETLIYDMDAPDKDMYDKFPDFIKEMLDNQASPELYAELQEKKEEETTGEM